MFYFIAIAALGYLIFSKKYSHFTKQTLIVLFIIMLLCLPYQSYMKKEIKETIDLVQEKINQAKTMKVSKDGIEITSMTQPGPSVNSPPIDLKLDDKNLKNAIKNGNFIIPFSSKHSAWGHGLYSDQIRAYYPKSTVSWINFLNADIDVSVQDTELGPALKIVHKSNTKDNSIGVMEQRINAFPGKYRLSFWAKALDDFEISSLWIVTTDNWVIKEDGIQKGYELDKKGPFDWEYFSKEIDITTYGNITFSIISAGKGTLYITDISLIKQN